GATHPALAMQRAAGNAALTSAVQHHLRQPARGDEGEEQARRAADAAIGGPASVAVRAPPSPIGADLALRRAGAGHGMPLDGWTRGSMEQRFGHDFADVRVHTGGEAAATAAAVDADAFTV